ncbi:MAG: RecX family transcriptional regulator [Flavobacteriaceae bacterium]|nr:RecX family transcriptional regulator [Flavobacteriaceae bacterium]MCY4216903.1 RecX family transcriptional regulator [Flavobacteriaceae bacterium]MCY4253570.1 RecX family transcriptional regulator [Flavobacteriaceae bacterium]
MSLEKYKKKLEFYCQYQDRCHQEVNMKMRQLKVPYGYQGELKQYLIEENFLNEKRFVESFVIGKFNQSHWGNLRLISELKTRDISDYLVQYGLNLIDPKDYVEQFISVLEKAKSTYRETPPIKANKLISDYLKRRGWEPQLILEYLN